MQSVEVRLPEICIFCQARRANSREHWPPKWMQSISPSTGFAHAVSIRRETPLTGYGHQLGVKSKTIRVVCSICNSGWMSALQNRAKHILYPDAKQNIAESGFRGAQFLDSDDQHFLRRWFLMTSAVIEHFDRRTKRITPQTLKRISEKDDLHHTAQVIIYRTAKMNQCGFNHVVFDSFELPSSNAHANVFQHIVLGCWCFLMYRGRYSSLRFSPDELSIELSEPYRPFHFAKVYNSSRDIDALFRDGIKSKTGFDVRAIGETPKDRRAGKMR